MFVESYGHDPFPAMFSAAVGAFGDAVEHDAEAIPGIIAGVEVAAEAAYAVDEAGFGDDPAAEVGAVETIQQRAIFAGDGQAFDPFPLRGKGPKKSCVKTATIACELIALSFDNPQPSSSENWLWGIRSDSRNALVAAVPFFQLPSPAAANPAAASQMHSA